MRSCCQSARTVAATNGRSWWRAAAHDTRGVSLVETLVTLAITAAISAVAVPMMANTIGYFRLSGDARGISNSIAVAKIRAASDFSQVRLFVDLSTKSHHIETWNKATSQWTPEGGTTYLSTGTTFGYSIITNAPPNTQGSIGQAAPCKDNAGNDIGNTACVIFNSRGVPVNSTVYALYVTDNTMVHGITVSATGMVRSWRAAPHYTASWVLQ
jgi:Tfp pilus assembly protein FimT